MLGVQSKWLEVRKLDKYTVLGTVFKLAWQKRLDIEYMVLIKYNVSDCRTLFFFQLFFSIFVIYVSGYVSGKTCPHGDFAVIGIVCFTTTVKPVWNGPLSSSHSIIGGH